MKRKLYVLSIPETELDLHLERWEVAKKYGFELPTAHFCSECHDWLSYTWIGSELRHDLPYSCPQQIIDECNNLCNTHSWLCEDYPSLKIEILYPYLVKWTHILKESGFDITGILSPGTTFVLHLPPILFVPLVLSTKNLIFLIQIVLLENFLFLRF